MNLHIPIESNSSLRLNDAECAAFAKRRRRAFLIVLALSALSWLVIGKLILALV